MGSSSVPGPTAAINQQATLLPTNTRLEQTAAQPNRTTKIAPMVTASKEVDMTPSTISGEAAIRLKLAQRLNVTANDLSISSLETVVWSNTCLGAPNPGEDCQFMDTPGLIGLAKIKDQEFEFRSDTSGENLRLIPSAATAAGKILAQQLGIPAQDIIYIQIEQVNWPDGCLGVHNPGQFCTQVITPGYRVILNVNGKTYEFHTDISGNQVVQANQTTGPISTLPSSDR